MKNITVGLDFGTHQTKICIEDSNDSNQKTYEFFQFSDDDNSSFFLPSIVQINQDNRITYGWVEDQNCKVVPRSLYNQDKCYLRPPILIVEAAPIKKAYPIDPSLPVLPAQPRKINYPERPSASSVSKDWKEQLREIKNAMTRNSNEHLTDWDKECRKIDGKNKQKLSSWEIECKAIKSKYEKSLNEWKKVCFQIDEDYEESIKLYKKKQDEHESNYNEQLKEFQYELKMQDYLVRNADTFEVEREKLIFRNFKIAVFSEDFLWAHEIEADVISVWYLTNLIFLLEAKYGKGFRIQMGVPRSIDRYFSKKQEVKALCILVAAKKLREDFESHLDFLNRDYNNLLDLTRIEEDFSEDDLNSYGLDLKPEAYAGLITFTRDKRLPKGMNLLIDIGGGSTDIAFFTIDKLQPDVYAVSSIHKGLNLIFGRLAASKGDLSPHDIQSLSISSEEIFEKANSEIELLQVEIREHVATILRKVTDAFITISKDRARLNEALKYRPVVFAGGGANLSFLNKGVRGFTDIKKVTKDSFPYGNLIGEKPSENLMPLLCTAFGLSIAIEDEIQLKDIGDLFAHLDDGNATSAQSDNDYGLIDT
jgi:hypothetical protein